MSVPDDPLHFGPWAGKIVTGGEDTTDIKALDGEGNVTHFDIGVPVEDLMVVPPNENFFGVDYDHNTLFGASASQFTGMVGDILVAEEFGAALWHVHWNGITFETTQISQLNHFEHTVFAPIAMPGIPASEVVLSLAGTASDDGHPTGSTLTDTWTVASGPGAVVFSNPSSRPRRRPSRRQGRTS